MINKICENLYLSDWKGASNFHFIKELGITKIISLGDENEQKMYKFYDDVEYLKIVIEDKEEENIYKYFEKTNKFISDGNVLVHCNKGISRSSTIIISYFMNKGLTYKQSYRKIKKIHYIIKPNEGFVKQLIDYYK